MKTKRKIKLGTAGFIGAKRVTAWCSDGHLYFHKLYDREPPAKISLNHVYNMVNGELLKT